MKLEEYVDVRKAFENTNCNFIKNELKKGNHALGLKIPNAGGLFSKGDNPAPSFSVKLCEEIKKQIDDRGFISTDELPAYGITEKEVEHTRKLTKASKKDVLVFSFAEKKKAIAVLNYVRKRVAVDF